MQKLELKLKGAN